MIIFLNNTFEYFNPDPCSAKLSDRDFLLHMIPHHQVAVDISRIYLDITKNPSLQLILRNIIWSQTLEITMMEELLDNLPKISVDLPMKNKYVPALLDYYEPDKSTVKNVSCDKHFFDSKQHLEHIKHMKLTDEYFLDHMTKHHQVAVDMSKRLLKYTENDFMIEFAYKIIRNQQAEILTMNYLLDKKRNIKYNSTLF